MVLFVRFEHWLQCKLVCDIFHSFKTMNIVGIFGIFLKSQLFNRNIYQILFKIIFYKAVRKKTGAKG